MSIYHPCMYLYSVNIIQQSCEIASLCAHQTTTFAGHIDSPHKRNTKRQNANLNAVHVYPKQSARPNSKELLFFPRHPHISINCGTKRRKTRTAPSRCLRPGLSTQYTTSDTPGADTIRKIVLRAQSLNTALGARVQGAHDAKVLGRRPGARAHIFEAVAELLAPGEVRDLAALGGQGGVVGHLPTP